MKSEEVIRLASDNGYETKDAVALKREASGREYWRISNTNSSYVLCYQDPLEGSHDTFINISKSLENHKINASRVLFHNPEIGITIQTDIGDADLLSIMNEENKKSLIQQSLELLCKFQSIDIPNLSKFSKKELEDQSSLFIEVFCSQFLEIKSTDALKEFVKQTVENIMLQPWANCHFDYERRNLISDLTENKIHMIDYQDTRIGPIGIDIAGILLDHYYPLNKQDINGHLDFYKSISVYKDKELDFFEILRWGGIQRNLRILGVLSRLSIEKNLDFRLKDIPMIFNNLIDIMPKNSPGYSFLTNTVKNKLNERIHNL